LLVSINARNLKEKAVTPERPQLLTLACYAKAYRELINEPDLDIAMAVPFGLKGAVQIED
jgi:hypothetical protein